MGKIGKIDAALFAEYLAGNLGADRSEIVVGPKNGVDAGIFSLGNGKVLIIAEDPIFPAPLLSSREFGWLTTHIGASDVAVTGVAPQFMTYSLLMPPGTPDEEFREITAGIHESCKDLGIAIVGGHTGYYGGLAMPIIGGVTVFSVADENTYVTPAGARLGNVVLMTKGPAIEAAALLAITKRSEIAGSIDASLIDAAASRLSQVTVVKDALTAYAAGGVTGMHDATEGGVLGGLYEIAEASGVGMEVWEDKCILPPDVLALCKQFDLDPFGVIAEGCLLITAEADAAPNIIAALTREQIPASVIGTILADPAVRIMHRSNGQDDVLAVPPEEPFWKIYP